MRKSLHPMHWLAAGAVTIFCLTGTAAFLGWLPGSAANTPEHLVATADDVAPGEVAEPTTAVEPEPAPAKPVVVEKPRAPTIAPPRIVTAPVATPQAVRAMCADCGTVVNIENVQQRAKGSGVGAVAGGVVGGVLGNQVGKGKGRDLATIAGAVIGGVAGHNVERNITTPRTRYRTTVELDNGQMHSFTEDEPPMWSVGDVIVVPNTVPSPPATSRGIYEEDRARF